MSDVTKINTLVTDETENKEFEGVVVLKPEDYYREYSLDVQEELQNREKPVENVLLLSMSVFNKRELEVNEYQYRKGELDIKIEGHTQLEPVPKMLSQVLSGRNEKLDMILVLATREGKDETEFKPTGYKCNVISYFTREIQKVSPETEVIVIDAPKEDESPAKALKDVVNIIRAMKRANPQLHLYLDMHGGLRHVQLILDAIVFALRNEDIAIEGAYSVAFAPVGEKVSNIIEVNEYIKIFEYVSGINEFMNLGQGNTLREFFGNAASTRDVVKSINNISNELLLCQIDPFEDALDKMNDRLIKYGEKDSDDYLRLFVDSFKDNYHTEYGDLLDKENRNLKAELSWALEKLLYQQALAILEAKFPAYYWRYLKEEHIQIEAENKPISLEPKSIREEFKDKRLEKIGLINILMYDNSSKNVDVTIDKGYCILKWNKYLSTNRKTYSMMFPTLIREEYKNELQLAIKRWRKLKLERNNVMHVGSKKVQISSIVDNTKELLTALDTLDKALEENA